MAAEPAFQSDAFQEDAFQIVIQGGPGPTYPKLIFVDGNLALHISGTWYIEL